jgi:hypothetical protein
VKHGGHGFTWCLGPARNIGEFTVRRAREAVKGAHSGAHRQTGSAKQGRVLIYVLSLPESCVNCDVEPLSPARTLHEYGCRAGIGGDRRESAESC